ncbi:MAG TPA: LemA family protein [Cyclobacteriaceae bacterium]
MRSVSPLCGIASLSLMLFLLSCQEKKTPPAPTSFTKTDSLTDTYLSLQDSVLQAWNMMLDDDNQKIKAMHNLTHELMVTDKEDIEKLVSIEQRLEQLTTLRYNQQTMGNPEVVEQYDFATNSLISELISIAEAQAEFQYNSTLQKLVDNINLADQRVNSYREEYDYIISRYNRFLEENKTYLKEIDPQARFEKMPVFEMAEAE